MSLTKRLVVALALIAMLLSVMPSTASVTYTQPSHTAAVCETV